MSAMHVFGTYLRHKINQGKIPLTGLFLFEFLGIGVQRGKIQLSF